jgi:hypothetical protein
LKPGAWKLWVSSHVYTRLGRYQFGNQCVWFYYSSSFLSFVQPHQREDALRHEAVHHDAAARAKADNGDARALGTAVAARARARDGARERGGHHGDRGGGGGGGATSMEPKPTSLMLKKLLLRR